MLKKISGLIETRKLIALIITATLVVLAIQGKIETNDFMSLATMVIAFYFSFKKE